MKIIDTIKVPTGYIVVAETRHGKLEFLSIGDYGKDVNLNKNTKVNDGLPMMPLTDKWVITISTQYGCSMGCKFCDVPKVGKGLNCTMEDLKDQILIGLLMFPEVEYSNRLNVHYARMGEPSWNPNVLIHAGWMHRELNSRYNIHPVFTTMMPKRNASLRSMVREWVTYIKNDLYQGNAGLQLSINGTNEKEREFMFSGSAYGLADIATIMEDLKPVGRKFTLNFPIANWEIDPDVLLKYFDPEHYICKLTPIHKTKQCEKFAIETEGDYTTAEPYKEVQKNLENAGYEVLVFVTSEDEDRGMITCGNAILANTQNPRLREHELNFIGGSPVGSNPFRPWNSTADPFQTSLIEPKIGA